MSKIANVVRIRMTFWLIGTGNVRPDADPGIFHQHKS